MIEKLEKILNWNYPMGAVDNNWLDEKIECELTFGEIETIVKELKKLEEVQKCITFLDAIKLGPEKE